MTIKAPPPQPRPKLAWFIFERGLELKVVASALGCSYEQVRLICLPFSDDRRRVPGAGLMERIVAWTDGVVQPIDFYPPHLSTREPAATTEGAPA